MKQGFFVALINFSKREFKLSPLSVLSDLRYLVFCHLSGNLSKLLIIIYLNDVQF